VESETAAFALFLAHLHIADDGKDLLGDWLGMTGISRVLSSVSLSSGVFDFDFLLEEGNIHECFGVFDDIQ
jgi:hypothetical protein